MFSQSSPFSGSILPLDLPEGVSTWSRSLSCQLIVGFNKDLSEIHHGLDIDRLAPAAAYKDPKRSGCHHMTHTFFEKWERERRWNNREERKAGKAPLLSPGGEERRGGERGGFEMRQSHWSTVITVYVDLTYKQPCLLLIMFLTFNISYCICNVGVHKCCC